MPRATRREEAAKTRQMSAPTILIAAPKTDSGKTLVTLGLLRALRRRDLRVAGFKVGPDYIDPGFLTAAAGRPALNLDSWAMRLETLVAGMAAVGSAAEIVVGEGVMGLFDGAPDGTGSTADIAALFDLPVVLVVDAAAQGQSVAALIEGFQRFREDVAITGIVLNRVSGQRHADLLVGACEERFATPVLGWLAQDATLDLPRRHLGLVQASEHAALEAFIDGLAARIEGQLDVGRIIRQARTPSLAAMLDQLPPVPPLGQRIAVARDAAFGFAYPAMLAAWRDAGAELAFFSPLADEAPGETCDAVFLPGGYPELHAGRLAASGRFLAGLRRAAAAGGAVYGECGGYMVMGELLEDAQGQRHAMAGLLPVSSSFRQRRLQLGYRRLVLAGDGPLGAAGTAYRGHEFHYASQTAGDGEPFARAADARAADLGPVGYRSGRVMGSFLHLIDHEA